MAAVDRSPTGVLMSTLEKLQDLNKGLIALYDQRLNGHHVRCRGRPPRGWRRLQASLRATLTAQARTARSIRKLRRYMDEAG